MTGNTKRYIAVIGRHDCSEEEANLAFNVGRLVAEAGAVLICGGLGGIMEAASRGAKSAGGTTIGVLPGTCRDDANPYIDHAICTGIREARNLAIVLTADGVIALPGEFGTLSEISFALKYRKPVVSLRSWNVSERILRAETAEEAVETILREVNR